MHFLFNSADKISVPVVTGCKAGLHSEGVSPSLGGTLNFHMILVKTYTADMETLRMLAWVS